MKQLKLLQSLTENSDDFFSNLSSDTIDALQSGTQPRIRKNMTSKQKLEIAGEEVERAEHRMDTLTKKVVRMVASGERGGRFGRRFHLQKRGAKVSHLEFFSMIVATGDPIMDQLRSVKVDPNDTQIINRLVRINNEYHSQMEAKKKAIEQQRRYLATVTKSSVSDMAANTPRKVIPDHTMQPSFMVLDKHGSIQKSITNPYLLAKHDKPHKSYPINEYAGHPAHFGWFGRDRTIYATINAKLVEYNLDQFDELYAYVIPKSQQHKKAKIHSYFLTTPDGKVVLIKGPREKDPSFYIDGERISLYYALKEKRGKVDAALKALAPSQP